MVQPIDRAKNIEVNGSPTYPYNNLTAIAPNGLEDIDFEANSLGEAKYLPFDSVAFKNKSGADLKITVGAHIIFVPSNAIVKKTDIAFRRIRIDSDDAAATCQIGELSISAWVEPLNQDALVRKREARKLRFFGS